MAVVVQLVLSLLGTGIGLGTIDPLHFNTPDASTLGIGAGLWLVISSVVALYLGGWVAGHLSGSPIKSDAVLHGLLTWGLATIVTVYLLASLVSSIVSGGASVVSRTAGVAASGIGAAAGPAGDLAKDQLAANGITLDSVKGQVQKLLAQTGNPALQPGAIADQAKSAAGQMTSAAGNAGATGNAPADDLQGTLQRLIASGKDTIGQADRDSVVNVIMAQTGATRPEAEQRTDAWIKQYQDARAQFEQKKTEAEAKAREAADATASATSKAALGAGAALILGAIAAALGGHSGRRRMEVITDVRREALAG